MLDALTVSRRGGTLRPIRSACRPGRCIRIGWTTGRVRGRSPVSLWNRHSCVRRKRSRSQIPLHLGNILGEMKRPFLKRMETLLETRVQNQDPEIGLVEAREFVETRGQLEGEPASCPEADVSCGGYGRGPGLVDMLQQHDRIFVGEWQDLHPVQRVCC